MGSQVSAVLVPKSLTVQEDKHNFLSQPSISQYLYLDSFASITHSLKKNEFKQSRWTVPKQCQTCLKTRSMPSAGETIFLVNLLNLHRRENDFFQIDILPVIVIAFQLLTSALALLTWSM